MRCGRQALRAMPRLSAELPPVGAPSCALTWMALLMNCLPVKMSSKSR